jgi:diphosphomevalonate decarboxylase
MILDYKNPKLFLETANLEPGEIVWRSPSNIAIVKYWGKHGVQLPRNPSISLTLENCRSETLLQYDAKETPSNDISLDFYFDGALNETFGAKTKAFFESLDDIFPFLKQLHFTIHSGNSFPHSSGIASSASGMSALALSLCSLEDKLFGTLEDPLAFDQKASFLARLGSGSASRSIYPHLAVWGQTGEIEGSSDLYATPYSDQTHEIFKGLHDAIMLVSKAEKSVSSRAGHRLMEGNPYADSRYQQAKQRIHDLIYILKAGDMEAFGAIAESEALTLHALMMSSNPSYILMRPNTLRMIELIRDYRAQTKQAVYFSLDAGPNIHLLYPDDIKEQVQLFIDEQLEPLCENRQWIKDWVGEGPVQLE